MLLSQFKGAQLLALLFVIGCTNAVPYYGDFMHHFNLPTHRFLQQVPLAPLDTTHGIPNIWQEHPYNINPLLPGRSNSFGNDETEFVPLEEQENRPTEGPINNAPPPSPETNQKPFEVDLITTDVGGGNQQSPAAPGFFFQQSFPFFGNDFFNSFGGFGIDAGPVRQPWWKGVNVCTERSEEEKDTDANTNNEDVETEDDVATSNTDLTNIRSRLFGQFHFSVNSCVEKPNKYVCTRIINRNGKRKTLTVTHQCCHGYGRPRNADFATGCEKIDIKNLDDTAAEMGAKEFIAIAKSNGLNEMLSNRKNVTIFMPIDNAFTAYTEQMQSENSIDESKSNSNMRNLVARHIVDGDVNLDEVNNEQILKTQVNGQTIRINAYQLPLTLGPEPYRLTANCVPIEKHDKLTEQGLVHTLGGVMKPVNENVMDIIRKRADMSIMRTVLENTKLSELLEGEKPVTIFVPTDDSFDKLEPHLRRALKEGKGCATNILKNHILDLTFCSVASIAGAKTTAYNLLGEPLRFNRTKTTKDNSEIADLLEQQAVFINGMAKIVEADIMGTNGVLHVIDTILPTKSALPLSTLMHEKNVTIFAELLNAAGLDNQFDDLDNVTILAPTDKALENTKWAKVLADNPEILKDDVELKDFLNYHVVRPMIKTCDLSEKLLPTDAGAKVRVNLYSTHALFSNVMNRATVNCARLVHFDDESCGSVLHQLDKPLTPPKMTLLEVLESNPNYSKFLELVRLANLTDLLSKPDDSFTLLVPKDEVFAEVDGWEKGLTKNTEELENQIKSHIVNDVVCCAGIIPTNWPFVRTIESLNGLHLRITRDRRPKIENAGVTKCDTIATNGIIHEINDIIYPTKRQQNPFVPQQLPQHPQHPQQQQQPEPFADLFF